MFSYFPPRLRVLFSSLYAGVLLCRINTYLKHSRLLHVRLPAGKPGEAFRSVHFLTFSRTAKVDKHCSLAPPPKRITRNEMAGKSKARCVITSSTHPNHNDERLNKQTKKKQHADRAPHLDRTNGVLLYHPTRPHGPQAGRGQVRSTRYVCVCVSARFFIVITLLAALRPSRVCVRVLKLFVFHSEAKSAICGE